jgi:hemolysin III
MLSRRSRGDWVKQTGMLLYSLGLVLCYGGSWLFHAVRLSPPAIAVFNRLDQIGIYLLIAGSGSPIALVVLRGVWRAALLGVLWLLAASEIIPCLFGHPIPIQVSAFLYLVMGWIGCVTYFELAHHLSHAKIRLLWIGGILYTIGAILNVLNWPTLLPGVFGPHEVFHLFVMAGTACHCYFLTLPDCGCSKERKKTPGFHH